ncbi:hypothetical protein BJV82DRAFT_685299 [Fennellomyces sp. T-0311]|nr:hypothetical protein BJV82DRAFT_685299 [Fennellomyces sp. T-0311]
MVYDERIFLVGATGNIGQPLVRKLLLNLKVALTLYARNPARAQKLYGEQAEGDRFQIVQGDYDNRKPFEDTIAGHTRLFILVQSSDYKTIGPLVRAFAETGYAAGVQQVVLVSGIAPSMPWRSSLLTDLGYQVEEAVLHIPNRKPFVTLRPAYFMSNQLQADAGTIRNANKIIDIRELDQAKPWISPNDIGELAAIILQDPIEKHGEAVYEMVGDSRTPTEHAEILSRVLGRTITYEKVTDQQFYDTMTKQAGMHHAVAYMFLQVSAAYNHKNTPGLSILLGHPPETLEHWIEQNKSKFL